MTPEQNAHVKTLRGKKEIFDYVVTHLKNQGSQSLLQSLSSPNVLGCAYRGADNKMCAVGCLIADDEYNPDMEACNINELSKEGAIPDRLEPHLWMLAELQALHDNPGFFSQSEEGKIRHLRRLEAHFFDVST